MSEEQNAPITDVTQPTTGPAQEQPPIEVTDDGESVTQPAPHETMPGYGVTGKFQQDDPDADEHGDAGDGSLVSSAPASETDGLEVAQQGPATAEQPASQADQLDAPAPARGDTA